MNLSMGLVCKCNREDMKNYGVYHMSPLNAQSSLPKYQSSSKRRGLEILAQICLYAQMLEMILTND